MNYKYSIAFLLVLAVVLLIFNPASIGKYGDDSRTTIQTERSGHADNNELANLGGVGNKREINRVSPDKRQVLIAEFLRDIRASEKQRCILERSYEFEGVHHLHFKIQRLADDIIPEFQKRLADLESMGDAEETLTEIKNQYSLFAPTKEYGFLVTYDPNNEEICSSNSSVNEFGEEVFYRTTTTLSKIQKAPEKWRYSHIVDLIPVIKDQ